MKICPQMSYRQSDKETVKEANGRIENGRTGRGRLPRLYYLNNDLTELNVPVQYGEPWPARESKIIQRHGANDVKRGDATSLSREMKTPSVEASSRLRLR